MEPLRIFPFLLFTSLHRCITHFTELDHPNPSTLVLLVLRSWWRQINQQQTALNGFKWAERSSKLVFFSSLCSIPTLPSFLISIKKGPKHLMRLFIDTFLTNVVRSFGVAAGNFPSVKGEEKQRKKKPGGLITTIKKVQRKDRLRLRRFAPKRN